MVLNFKYLVKFLKLSVATSAIGFMFCGSSIAFANITNSSFKHQGQLIPLKQKDVISSVIVLADHKSSVTPLANNTYKLNLAVDKKTIGILPIVPRGPQEFISPSEFYEIWNAKENNVKQDPPDAIIHYFLKGKPYHEVVKVTSLKVLSDKAHKSLQFNLTPVAGIGFDFPKGKVTSISPMSLFIDNFGECGGVNPNCIIP